MLLEVGSHLPTTYASCDLWSVLVAGVKWLKNALEIFLPCNRKKFKLSYVEEVLQKSQVPVLIYLPIAPLTFYLLELHILYLELRV